MRRSDAAGSVGKANVMFNQSLRAESYSSYSFRGFNLILKTVRHSRVHCARPPSMIIIICSTQTHHTQHRTAPTLNQFHLFYFSLKYDNLITLCLYKALDRCIYTNEGQHEEEASAKIASDSFAHSLSSDLRTYAGHVEQKIENDQVRKKMKYKYLLVANGPHRASFLKVQYFATSSKCNPDGQLFLYGYPSTHCMPLIYLWRCVDISIERKHHEE